MMWQMPTSPSGWKEIRLRLSRSSPQTIGYRPRLFNAELGLAQPKRTSDRGSALSGTGRWLAAVDPRAGSWLQRHRFRIGIWAASFAFGRATVMEWIVLGFLLMHFYCSLEFLGDFSTHSFPEAAETRAAVIARATQCKRRCRTDQTRTFGSVAINLLCLNWTFGASP
jgi:hypothetical protein